MDMDSKFYETPGLKEIGNIIRNFIQPDS